MRNIRPFRWLGGRGGDYGSMTLSANSGTIILSLDEYFILISGHPRLRAVLT